MKTILLFDPRFPDRRPRRLTVEDQVASAAVRAGIAAAANPEDAGALAAGGPLDGGMLTPVVLQHGNGGLTRVVLPYSVTLVAAGLGLAASIGTPLSGVIVTPTPSPTPTPTPTPAPTPTPTPTRNATTFAESSRNERLVLTPANMTSGNGLYFFHVVDVRDHPVWTGKVDWLGFASTDHAASGQAGIWQYFFVGDDFETAIPYGVEDAKAMGLLSRISNPPTSNPVFGDMGNGAGITQMETPWVTRLPDNTFSMSFQVNNVTSYRYFQAAFRATSVTGCGDWVLPTGRTGSDALLTNNSTETLGDGHTGYPEPFLNTSSLFPQLIDPTTGQPWVMLAVGLAGGTDKTSRVLWGMRDPKGMNRSAAGATQIRSLHRFGGAIADQTALNGQATDWIFDSRTIQRLSDGSYSAIVNMATTASGASDRTSTMVEMRFTVDALGYFTPISKPKVILGKGPNSGPRGDGAGHSCAFIDRKYNKWHALYIYRDSSTGYNNTVGRISGPLRDPNLTIYEPLSVDLTKRSVDLVDLRNLGGTADILPAKLKAAKFGTTNLGAVGRSPNAKGVQIVVKQDTVNFDSEGSMWYDKSGGFDLSQYSMLDVYVTGVQEESGSSAYRNHYCGFASQQLAQFSTITDGVFFSNKGSQTPENSTASLGLMHWRVGGPTINYTASDQYFGFGNGTDGRKFLLAFGWRIYPPSTAYPNGRLMLLGEGRAELTELAIPVGWDWTKPLYPFYGVKTYGSGTASSFTRVATFEVGTISKSA